jgi:UDP-N-acetylmuramoylalanine--D-glutamate ligase
MIWTNFAEDHLDWHGNMLQYFEAKWNALKRVGDGPIVMGQDVMHFARALKTDLPIVAEVVDSENFKAKGNSPLSRINQINVEYVKRFVGMLGMEGKNVDRVASRFAFLPHRLEKVGETNGVRFWNDSKATNFHSVEAALEGFDTRVVWLGGGLDKGGDMDAFAQRIACHLRYAYTFGSVGQALANALEQAGVRATCVPTMREAMTELQTRCEAGDDVLLSPGFASFDQFKGYADRGTQFRQLVAELFPATGKQPVLFQH